MKKVLIVFALLLLASPALPQSAVPFATYMTARPTGAVPLVGTEPTLIFQGGLVKQVSTQAYVLQSQSNPPAGTTVLGSGGGTPYATLNLNSAAIAPSLVFNSAVPFAINSGGGAFVCALDVTNNNEAWCQSRSSLFTGNNAAMLLQPFLGGLAFDTVATGLETGFNRGLQQGPQWMSSTYEPESPTAVHPGGFDIWNDAAGVAANPGGLVVKGRTDNDVNGFNTQNLSSFCYANNSSGARGCWPIYTEGHRMQGSGDYAFGLGEAAMANRVTPVVDIRPLNTVSTGGSLGLQMDCGNGQSTPSAYTLYSCSAGLIFTNNLGSGQNQNYGFLHGIVFRFSALDSSIYNPPDAIALTGSATRQAISWWSSATNRAWLIYSDASSGNNTFDLSQGGIINSAHLSNGGGTPTAGSCTGFTAAPNSTDSNGAVTFSSAATCSIKFNVSYTNPPFCVITPASTPSALVVATANTTTLTATFSANLTGMIWHCAGQ